MPKSKRHSKRRSKLQKRKDSFDSLIKKRVDRFNSLPEVDKLSILAGWKARLKKEGSPVDTDVS